MPNYQKYVNGLFLGAAAVVWMIASHYTEAIIGYVQLGRKLNSQATAEVILHTLPIVLALGTFAFFRMNTKTYNYCLDAVAELSRVIFPGAKEVRFGTIIVIITVVLAGVALGVLDLGLSSLIKGILAS